MSHDEYGRAHPAPHDGRMARAAARQMDVRRSRSVIEALLVVTLWSATPPLAKLVMIYLPPLEFLGLRYAIAFVALVPIVRHHSAASLKRLSQTVWLRLAIMGLLAYPVANGLQFWALSRLPATTGTFTIHFVPLFAMLLGAVWLAERPRRLQLAGVGVTFAGALLFFGIRLPAADGVAVAASILGSFMLAINAVMARAFARTGQVDSVLLAAIPLAVGGGLLLIVTPPSTVPPVPIIGILAFLALISGALAYTVWNHALRGLQAFEITLIGNLMPMGTAVLAPLILGEAVSGRMWLGMAVSLLGVLLVTVRRQPATGAAT